MNFLFASTARGLEELLKTELEALGASQCKVTQGGVYFQADERVMYQSLLWSRLASRILLHCRFSAQCFAYLSLFSDNLSFDSLLTV